MQLVSMYYVMTLQLPPIPVVGGGKMSRHWR